MLSQLLNYQIIIKDYRVKSITNLKFLHLTGKYWVPVVSLRKKRIEAQNKSYNYLRIITN